MSVLVVNKLKTTFETPEGLVRAVEDVSLSVEQGQTLGIVGESGCGKSVTLLTIMGLLSARRAACSGEVFLLGENLVGASSRRLRELRGNTISMIFQDPLTSLNPVKTVGGQLVEAIRLHNAVSRGEAGNQARRALEEVGIADADVRLRSYPHQLSGGMRQRVMIAMAMLNKPSLLLADEPTTALDVTTQAQILALISKLQEDYGTAVVIVTHDLGVVAETAQRVAVMYAGRIVETASAQQIFDVPRHPYTWGLLGSQPRLVTTGGRLEQIPGQPPSLLNLSSGCAFSPRCSYTMDVCRSVTPALCVVPNAESHSDACFLDDATKDTNGRDLTDRLTLEAPVSHGRSRPPGSENGREGLLRVERLSMQFRASAGQVRRGNEVIHAVDDVSFTVQPGETLGIVGESGCGKSTLARCLARLHEPTSGSIEFNGADITHASRADLRSIRRNIGFVFQDPFGSLNSKRRVRYIVEEPLLVHEFGDAHAREERVQELLEIVGLNPEHANRWPHEFSGGQRQRIGIARALAMQPRLIICDEPVSALDVSVQAQILNLLKDLQRRFGLTYVFIAHDLDVVRYISDRVLVMYFGKIVESGAADLVYKSPRHPYTGALLMAAPVADPAKGRTRERVVLRGEVPSATHPPSGCRFHPRCPRAVSGVCDQDAPELGLRADREVACHFPLSSWPMTAKAFSSTFESSESQA